MAQVIISGEPAGTWDDAVNVSGQTYTYEVDVTGITDMETLDAYMKDQGCMPYAVLPGGDGLGQGVVYLKTKYDHTNASDPTEQDVPVVSGMLSLGGIVALDPLTGGLDLGSYTLEGFFTKLAEDYVTNAIIRAMFLQFDATQLTEQFKDAVMGSLHAYTDAKGEVPIYVDKHGQAYVFSDMVETVREELVNLGAYSDGGVIPLPSVDAAISYTFTIPPSTTTSGSLTKNNYNAFDKSDLSLVSNHTLYRTMNGGHPVKFTRFHYTKKNGVTVAGDVSLEGGSFLLRFPTGSNAPMVLLITNDASTYYDNAQFYGYDTVTEQEVHIGTGAFKPTTYTYTYDGETKSIICFSLATYMSTNNDVTSVLNGCTQSLTASSSDDRYLVFSYLFGDSSEAISGVTKASDIPANFADLSYGLDGVLPDWWQKRKALAVPRAKHQAQADDDIYAKTPALPLDIPTDMALEDSYAGDSDLVTEGDIADELKEIIMDVLPTIIDEIIDYAQDPTIPDIPVSDHGDTPPEDPTLLSGASNGLWTIYNPTLSQVNSFGAWLWSSSILDQITRMFNSPIDAVIGFHMIYCTPTTGTSKHIKAGFLDSEVSAAEVTNQYVEINCGQVAVTEFYNNVLDYTNTRISIFLPFCGFFPLDTAVVMGSILEVTYRVDILTGTCLAQVKVIKQNSAAVMYSFAGNCAVQVPLTATTYTGMVGALVSTLSAGASLMTGNMIGAGASAMRAMTAGMTGLSGVRQSGSMGANAGALGIRTPYLVITHPTQANAFDFGAVSGLPANKTVRLGDVSGFTRVYATHLDAISGATADEIEQIREMLSNGVIL